MTEEEIRIANKTYRSKGSSVFNNDGKIRSLVARYIESNIDKERKLLDYGCGTYFVQGNYLKSLGFDVDGWDIGNNKPVNCVTDLENKYNVVYASNVLNTMSSKSMLEESLQQINRCLLNKGLFIANYPKTPRKLNLSNDEMTELIKQYFVVIKKCSNGLIVCQKKNA